MLAWYQDLYIFNVISYSFNLKMHLSIYHSSIFSQKQLICNLVVTSHGHELKWFYLLYNDKKGQTIIAKYYRIHKNSQKHAIFLALLLEKISIIFYL